MVSVPQREVIRRHAATARPAQDLVPVSANYTHIIIHIYMEGLPMLDSGVQQTVWNPHKATARSLLWDHRRTQSVTAPPPHITGNARHAPGAQRGLRLRARTVADTGKMGQLGQLPSIDASPVLFRIRCGTGRGGRRRAAEAERGGDQHVRGDGGRALLLKALPHSWGLGFPNQSTSAQRIK